MPVTVAGMASSHAYTFSDPSEWEMRRARTRGRYKAKYASEPPEVAEIANETLEQNQTRFKAITDGLARLKAEFDAFRPDAMILLGDDQDEHFHSQIPQFAIYTGDKLDSVDTDSGDDVVRTFRGAPELASHLAREFVDAGFDVLDVRAFDRDRLHSHAHAQILGYFRPQVPVIPIFLNAIHVPSPSPRRCYAFGSALMDALACYPRDARVVIYASGGLSHFSAGFPYPHYHGPFQVGSISEAFDDNVMTWIRAGEGYKLGELSSADLLENGEIELRQWIALMGALGARKPAWLVYGAFYRAIMGMGAAYWEPFVAQPAAQLAGSAS